MNIATVTGLKSETDVCFRLSVTRAGLTGPLSDKVCTKTAPPAPPTPTPTPTPPPTPTPHAHPDPLRFADPDAHRHPG